MGRTKERRAYTITLPTMLDGILWNLQWAGCNPEQTHPANKVIFAYHFICQVIVVSLLTAHFLKETLTLNSFSSYVMYVTILFHVFGKTFPLYLRRDTFLKIVRTLKEEFWTADTFEECKEQFERNVILAEMIFRWYRNFIGTVLVMYIAVPLFHHELILPIWIPFDASLLKTSLAYLLVINLSIVLSVGVSGYFGTIHCDYLVGFLLIAVVMQFQLLQRALQGVRNQPDSSKQFARYIRQHRILLGFVDDLTTLLKFPIFLQISCAMFAMCVCCYLFNEGSADYINTAKFVGYALASFFQMFLYCMASRILQHESGLVSQAVYFSDWYKSYDKDLWNSVQFIIMRSKKECLLTIWLVKLDLQLFIQVLQLSFSMFTLLQNTNNRSVK